MTTVYLVMVSATGVELARVPMRVWNPLRCTAEVLQQIQDAAWVLSVGDRIVIEYKDPQA